MLRFVGKTIEIGVKRILAMATLKNNPNLNFDLACKEIFESIGNASKEEHKRNCFSEYEMRIIEVLTSHDNDQRQNIRMKYKFIYGIDLKDHIKTATTGDLQLGLLSLLYTPTEYDARTLNKCLNMYNQKPLAAIEILTTRNSYELSKIERIYARKFKKNLDDDLRSFDSSLSDVLRALLRSNRPNDKNQVDIDQATKDAQLLYEAGKTGFKSIESEFIKVLCQRSFEQLRRTFNFYLEISGKDITASIKQGTTGYYEECLLTIVECVRDIPRFFAIQIKQDLDESRTESLLRCLISRSEIDLQVIKQLYEGLYEHSLFSRIENYKSGSFVVLLKAILQD